MSTTKNQLGPVEQIINKPIAIYTSLLLGLAGIILFVLLPLFVGATTEALSLNRRPTRLLASSDLFGFGLCSLSSLLWARKVNWRWASFLALGLIIIANYFSTLFLDQFEIFLGLRFLSGIGQGAAVSLYAAHISDTRTPEKYYAWFLILQTVSGVVGLFILPRLIPQFGPSIILYTQSALCLLALFAIWHWMPVKGLDRTKLTQEIRQINWTPPLITLLALLLFFVGQGGIWAYLERIGNAFGLSGAFIGTSLSLALAGGFFGPLTASWLGDRWGKAKPLMLTAVGQLIALTILFSNWSIYTFTAAIIIYSFFWNFGLPFMIGILIGVDQSGRTILGANPVFALGVSIAPLIASIFITEGNYYPVGVLGAIAIILCVGLFISVIPKLKDIHA